VFFHKEDKIPKNGQPCLLALAQWKEVLAVNLTDPFLCAKHAAKLMRQQGSGCIINIASTRALASEAFTESYSASKGGLLALP